MAETDTARRDLRLARPRTVLVFLISVAILLVVASALGSLAPFELVSVHLSVAEEQSLPTWFSVVQLFILAVVALAFAITSSRRSDRRVYGAGAILALFFSLDEQATIHESLTGALPDAFPRVRDHGAWIFLYGVLLAGLVLRLGRDLADLWQHRRRLLVRTVSGAAIFGAGAVGIEAIQYLTGFPALLTHIEELFEMVGVAVVLWAIYEELWPVTVVVGRRSNASR